MKNTIWITVITLTLSAGIASKSLSAQPRAGAIISSSPAFAKVPVKMTFMDGPLDGGSPPCLPGYTCPTEN